MERAMVHSEVFGGGGMPLQSQVEHMCMYDECLSQLPIKQVAC